MGLGLRLLCRAICVIVIRRDAPLQFPLTHRAWAYYNASPSGDAAPTGAPASRTGIRFAYCKEGELRDLPVARPAPHRTGLQPRRPLPPDRLLFHPRARLPDGRPPPPACPARNGLPALRPPGKSAFAIPLGSPPQDAVCQEPGHPTHQTARRCTDEQRQEAVHATGHTDDLAAPQRRQ